MNLDNFLDLCSTDQDIHLRVYDGEVKELRGTTNAFLSLLDDCFLKDFEVIFIRSVLDSCGEIQVDIKGKDGK